MVKGVTSYTVLCLGSQIERRQIGVGQVGRGGQEEEMWRLTSMTDQGEIIFQVFGFHTAIIYNYLLCEPIGKHMPHSITALNGPILYFNAAFS